MPLETANASVAPLLKQLSELHGQMLEQFQQSLVLMTKLFDRVRAADHGELQKELTRIQDVNAELGKLQTEVTHQTLARIAESQRPVPSDPTPMPGLPPHSSRTRTANTTEAIQEWVEHRIGALQKERSRHWEKLTGLVDGSSCEHEPLR